MNKKLIALIALLMLACTGTPEGIHAVQNFKLDRYLGHWYEVARLDHSFEKGLCNVTAEYTLREDGGITVLNKGWSVEKGEWKSTEGRAYFVDDPGTGHFKVSFFGPFYGAYVIFKLDETDYQYAFVTSYSKDYLWLLSRTPTVSDAITNEFIELSKNKGFKTHDLIFVDHTKPEK